MFRAALAFALAVVTCQVSAYADEMPYSRQWRPRYYGHYLPPARHVVEVVQPPYSGNFIINGIASPAFLPLALAGPQATGLRSSRATGTATVSRRCSIISGGTAPAKHCAARPSNP